MAASLSGVFNLQSFSDGGLPLASGRPESPLVPGINKMCPAFSSQLAWKRGKAKPRQSLPGFL